MTEPVKPVEPQNQPQDSIPKNKQEWAELAKNDPGKFAELTQSRMDTFFRQNKEFQEKLSAAEEREKNLIAELNNLKQPQQPVQQTQQQPEPQNQYPQNEAEWDQLFLERPAYATDLRNQYLYEQRNIKDEYNKAREQGVKTLITEHFDMYHCEKEPDGKLKLDKNGKPIVMVDPNTGLYAFNSESEKGKLWTQIYNEDPQGWNSLKNAPSLMMAEMERRLRQKGASMINQGQNNDNVVDQSGVAPQGVTPPKTTQVKFASDEEKVLAEKAVARGTYKNLEEYVQWRDRGNYSYNEQNSRPDFSKR